MDQSGAEFKQHWSFVAPTRPPVPTFSDVAWPRNPIDNFVLARMEAAGLRPSPEASRETLVRRLYLDLIGLPPTLEQVDAFLKDTNENAYELLVDELLASPHFGERMAMDWLDAARFADTNGYHLDNGRDMSRWRAWVIDAFNQNLPFDEFTIDQIAGDLLPNATPGTTDCQRIQSKPYDQFRRRGNSRGVPHGLHHRPREHDRNRLAWAYGRLRPVP